MKLRADTGRHLEKISGGVEGRGLLLHPASE